ncbi:Sel1 repeat protein [Arabidopsis thaliana]|uniref:Sel1 repeat protein n=2 Tax=Arabidopsis thaliana TaxID=3702 RepID=F4ISY9_ARATH|nr:Sel1 repeat protein [Arabidopsis thaliana]AEC09538.1 Sel1 repeat protein [Arabidopsis thaliana]|eukprot:NP_565889.2 Sel1 repeat protein [Arabidopsis thaliana]
MGKSIPVKTGLRGASAAVAGFIKSSKPIRPISSMDSSDKDSSSTTTTSETTRRFVPLSSVVSDCAKRWFKDTLEEAKAGNITMQVLLGQMYYSGYGVPKDARKGRLWITKASRVRSSVWKVIDKRPGYNASDSDSESD